MAIKSTHIVPAVGLILTGYLSMTGGMRPAPPSNFASSLKKVPVIETFTRPAIDPMSRSVFFTEAEWQARLKAAQAAAKKKRSKGGTGAGTQRSAARSAQATEPATSAVVLTGILIAGTRRMAIVNGDILAEGESRRDLVVTKIEPRRVHLKKQGAGIVLTMSELPPPALIMAGQVKIFSKSGDRVKPAGLVKPGARGSPPAPQGAPIPDPQVTAAPPSSPERDMTAGGENASDR